MPLQKKKVASVCSVDRTLMENNNYKNDKKIGKKNEWEKRLLLMLAQFRWMDLTKKKVNK